MNPRGQRGFSLVEAVVGLAVLALTLGMLGTMLQQSSRINRTQRVQNELQESARSCLSLTVQALRTAGWNPCQNSGVVGVIPFPTAQAAVQQVTLRADLDGDCSFTAADEIVVIRHNVDRVEWMRPNVSTAWETLATDISNDANDDGVLEPMFVLSSVSNPHTVRVNVTARSRSREVQSGLFQHYSASSLVTLRSNP